MDSTFTIANHIIDVANKRFATSGITAVKVDDICEEMGISKKTFYKYFQSKEHLVVILVEKIFNDIFNQLYSAQKNHDIIAETATIFELVFTFFNQFSLVFFEDIKTQYPHSFKFLVKMKEKMIQEIFEKNIKEGIALGIYNNSLNAKFIAKWWFEVIWLAYLQNYSFEDVRIVFISGLIQSGKV